MGDIVDFGIRLSYRPASLCSRYDNPNAGVNFILPPVRDYEFGFISLARTDKKAFRVSSLRPIGTEERKTNIEISSPCAGRSEGTVKNEPALQP
jgi:hypothetical protein